MGVQLSLSLLVGGLVSMCYADKYSYFDAKPDHRVEPGITDTVAALSGRHCSMLCLAAGADCMACNWRETTGTCELVGAHSTSVAAPGYTAYTRFCRKTELGHEFQGSLSVTENGRTCQRWDSDGSPHANLQPVERFHGGVFPENYCRNPDGIARPWCYTMDPDVRYEFCDIPLC